MRRSLPALAALSLLSVASPTAAASRPPAAARAEAPAAQAARSAASPAVPAAQAASPAFRRFALVAGTNDGGSRRVRLRYAHSDAAAFAGVLTELGGVRPEDLLVLTGARRKDFLAALDEMRGRIEAAGKASPAGRVELLVYYSGHSDEHGLLLGEEKVGYAEFRKRIDAVPARIRLAIVDACASGALTRLKGGRRLPAFAVDQSSSLSGYAFLTSSSGTESAQESDRIRASFFTHYLVTGLRGAADLNQDGKVTLGEAYEFAFHETLSQTEGSQAGAQHPSYDMRLTGTGDLVLTDLRGTSAGLVLDPALKGRLFVRAPSGALVAELQKPAGRKVELGLEPGLYDLRLDQGRDFFRTLVEVEPRVHRPVAFADFAAAAREPTRSRGDAPGDSLPPAFHAAPGADPDAVSPTATADQDAGWIPLRAAMVPSLGFPGSGAGPWSHNVSFNLLVGEARAIRGLQLSLLANRSGEELHGAQASALLNRSAGTGRGLQLAGFLNLAGGAHHGLQLAAANGASDLRGAQLGMINGASTFAGAQLGLLNASVRGSGAQVGLLNVAGRFRGAQVGLVNIAKESRGAVLGAVNIVGNGFHDLETTVDEKSMLRNAVLLGGPWNYTWYSFDMKARYPRHLWGGSAGLGVHLPSGPLFAGFDLGSGVLWNEEDWDNYSVTGRLRWMAGFQPMRYFAVFGGLSYNLEAWPGSQYPNLNPGSNGREWGDARVERWTGFFLGVRI